MDIQTVSEKNVPLSHRKNNLARSMHVQVQSFDNDTYWTKNVTCYSNFLTVTFRPLSITYRAFKIKCYGSSFQSSEENTLVCVHPPHW